MADLKIVPHGYRKALGDSLLKHLANEIGKVAQSLDPTAPDPPLTYDQLGQLDMKFQIQAKNAARCSVRWCDPSQHRDAALRVRQQLASSLASPRLYHQLPSDAEPCDKCGVTLSQQAITELADAVLAAVTLHFEGRMSPLVPEERAELTGSKVQVVMGGESA